MTKRRLETFIIQACARAAHEANRAYCIALGDDSHPGWDQCSDAEKASTVLGVLGVVEKEYTPKQSHDEWVDFKRANGWVLGEKKDTLKKTHPCLIPWEDLPAELQIKDEMFMNVVKTIAGAMWRIPQ